MAFNEKIEEKRQEIANAVIKSFENDKEWEKGWYAINVNPHNGKTGRPYQGTNWLVLFITGEEMSYEDPRWITYNQAQELGASVKKGEKATSVFHYNEYDKLTKKPPDWEAIRKLPLEERRAYEAENITRSISYHSVFNAAQIANMPEQKLEKMSDDELTKRNELIERIIANSAAPITYGNGGAYYAPKSDTIRLPEISHFKTKEDYYATALHEIVHSTGHKSRLNRLAESPTREQYAMEELRAEFAAMFLQSELGLSLEGSHFENHGAYVKHWVEAIKEDKNVLFKIIKEAGEIASYIKENYATEAKQSEQTEQPSTASKGTVLWQSYSQIKSKNPDSLVFYRVGDFYEVFGDDAKTVSQELDLVLTGRDVGLAERMPMAGIPFHSLDKYTQQLVAAGHKIAVCENPAEEQKHYDDIKTKQPSRLTVKPPSSTASSKCLDAIEANTPAEMKELPNWCVTKSWVDKETGERKKIVIDCHTGKWASPIDSTTWTTFDEALKYARENRGQGLTFAMKGSGLIGIDVDQCIDKDGVWNMTAREISAYGATMGNNYTYTEKSMSGTGLHLFFKGSLGDTKNKNEALGLEAYDTNKFISITGDMVGDRKVLSDCPERLQKYLSEKLGTKVQVQDRRPSVPGTQSDAEVIDRIRRSAKGSEFDQLYAGVDLCGNRSVSDFKLLNQLAFFTNGDESQMERLFRSSGLYRKEKGDAYVRRSVANAAATLVQSPRNKNAGQNRGKEGK